MESQGFRHNIKGKIAKYHQSIPGLRKFPLPAVAIIVGLGFLNAVVWAIIGVVLVRHQSVLSAPMLILD